MKEKIKRVLQKKKNNLYNNKSRPVKSNTTNYLGGYTDVESLIDFSGKTLLAITRHKRIANVDEIRTDEVFTYSDQDRLLTHTPPLPHESFRVALEYGNVSKLVMPLLFKVKLLKINK